MQRKARDGKIRKIEYALYNEKAIREAVEEARSGGRKSTTGGAGGHAFISDPTAGAAVRAAVELSAVTLANGGKIEWPERWLAVVDAVRAWCGRDMVRAEIFKRRYRGEGRFTTIRAVHIAERTYYSVLDDIQTYALQCACQAQLVRVF